MSKNHRENRNRRRADWIVSLTSTSGNVTIGFAREQALVTEATYRRDDKGGYTFTDSRGICADFPPGTVLHVMRKEQVDPEALFALGPQDEVLDSRA